MQQRRISIQPRNGLRFGIDGVWGESMHDMGRLFDRGHSSVFSVLAPTGAFDRRRGRDRGWRFRWLSARRFRAVSSLADPSAQSAQPSVARLRRSVARSRAMPNPGRIGLASRRSPAQLLSRFLSRR
jgi:hypothetical protein